MLKKSNINNTKKSCMPKRKTEKRKNIAIDKFPIFYLEISHDPLLFKLEVFFFFPCLTVAYIHLSQTKLVMRFSNKWKKFDWVVIVDIITPSFFPPSPLPQIVWISCHDKISLVFFVFVFQISLGSFSKYHSQRHGKGTIDKQRRDPGKCGRFFLFNCTKWQERQK